MSNSLLESPAVCLARAQIMLVLALGILCACSTRASRSLDAGIQPDANTGTTWTKDIASLVHHNCSGCHHTAGLAFALETYDQVAPIGQLLLSAMTDRRCII